MYSSSLHTPTQIHHPSDTQSLTIPAMSTYELKKELF